MHIRKSFWNLRSVTMFIIFFFVTDMFLRPLRSYAQTVNEATGPAMLAFLFCSNYFLKMIMLSIIYYYSNVPFMEKDRQYYSFASDEPDSVFTICSISWQAV